MWKRFIIIKSKHRGRLFYEVFCLSGSGRNDMLLSDSRVGGAYRRRGEPSPKVLPPCVMWLYWQLQCGVDPRQPEDHRQRAAAAQVNILTSLIPPGFARLTAAGTRAGRCSSGSRWKPAVWLWMLVLFYSQFIHSESHMTVSPLKY